MPAGGGGKPGKAWGGGGMPGGIAGMPGGTPIAVGKVKLGGGKGGGAAEEEGVEAG